MPRKFDPANVTVIYAEDDVIFRTVAEPAFTRAGIDEDRIHVADNGQEALVHLNDLQDGDADECVVMVLDVNMPLMDGKTCALEVAKQEKAGQLRRSPYVVCCSSGVEQVTFGDSSDESEPFHLTMPKPFSNQQVDLVLESAREWWLGGGGNCAGGGGGGGGFASGGISAGEEISYSSYGGGGANDYGGGGIGEDYGSSLGGGGRGGGGGGGGSFEIGSIDMILGDPEPICRMALQTALGYIGADEDRMVECDAVDEVLDAIKDLQGNGDSPLMIFLSNVNWASEVAQECESSPRKAFIVCTSVDGDGGLPLFHAYLPRQFQQADLQSIIEECRQWWA